MNHRTGFRHHGLIYILYLVHTGLGHNVFLENS